MVIGLFTISYFLLFIIAFLKAIFFSMEKMQELYKKEDSSIPTFNWNELHNPTFPNTFIIANIFLNLCHSHPLNAKPSPLSYCDEKKVHTNTLSNCFPNKNK